MKEAEKSSKRLGWAAKILILFLKLRTIGVDHTT